MLRFSSKILLLVACTDDAERLKLTPGVEERLRIVPKHIPLLIPR